jgi:thiamine-monophosphate kinase
MNASEEHGLIERHFRPLASAPGAFRLLDDAATYSPPPGLDLVLTKDGIAEGVHFLPGESGEAVARKAVRVNLSDLAAKGATPVGYLVLLALPPGWTEDWVADFARGLRADQSEFSIALYGGDTIRADTLVVSVTAFGTVPAGRAVRRGGARPGERVYVSGSIGDGALGLLAITGDRRLAGLDAESRDHLVSRYRVPQPRTGLAAAVLDFASAALDVSDGLVGDLDKLCAVSGVSARIQADRVPLSRAATAAVAANPDLVSLCLTGGDDYEILCTVPEAGCADFEAASAATDIQVTCIGAMVENGGEAQVLDAAGKVLSFGRRAFSHVDTAHTGR